MDDGEIRAKLREAGSSYADLPGKFVTVTQIVAWNLAYFRKSAGLTQEELGDRIGWSKAVVSAAERSWAGERVRQFTADDIVTIAAALGLPVLAFFLPPDDDGVDVHYLTNLPVARLPDGRVAHMCGTMHDLMWHLTVEPASDENGGEIPLQERYWSRYVGAVNSYLRADAVGELAEHLTDVGSEERIIEHLARLRAQYDALRELISDNDHLQAALAERLREVRTQRGPLSPGHGLRTGADPERGKAERGEPDPEQ